MGANPPQLSYATSRGMRLRYKLLLIALILSNLYFVVDKWGWFIPMHVVTLLRQRALLRSELNSETIVFDSEPARAEQLLQSPKYVKALPRYFPSGTKPVRALRIDEARTFRRFDDSLNRRMNELGGTSTRARLFENIATSTQTALVFAERRRSPSGNQRLVVVVLDYDVEADCVYLWGIVYPIIPFFGLRTHVHECGREIEHIEFAVALENGLEISAASASLDDKFTISYRTDTRRGEIRGSLLNDDSLQLIDTNPRTAVDQIFHSN